MISSLFPMLLYKAFAVMGECAFMLGTMGVASADEYKGYDENGNYIYAVTGDQDNVAVAVADKQGNYTVLGECAEAAPTRRPACTERK